VVQVEAGFKPGDTAFLIESNRVITEVTVVRCSGSLYVIKFKNGGGIQVKGHRLYATREEAETQISTLKHTEKRGYRSPYDYPH
jgi:hypothetical protein